MTISKKLDMIERLFGIDFPVTSVYSYKDGYVLRVGKNDYATIRCAVSMEDGIIELGDTPCRFFFADPLLENKIREFLKEWHIVRTGEKPWKRGEPDCD